MGNLVDYAKRELKIVGLSNESKDDFNRMLYKNVIEIVEKFADQGHSGSTAPYSIAVLGKLLEYRPLTPLKGTDDEWMDISETVGMPKWQNIRCGSVFKDKDGAAYDINAKVFYTEDDQSDIYTSSDSRVDITFPYTPEIEYVKLPKEES